MDVITSNVITKAITDKNNNISDRAKRSLEWKKRRDKRYKDKVEQETDITLNITWLSDEELEKLINS